MSKINKVLRRLKETVYFSFKFGISYSIPYFYRFITKHNLYKTRKQAIDILDKKFGSIVKANLDENYHVPKIDETQKNIFVFWAQGFDELPYLIDESIKRIKKYYSDYNLHLIDLNNYTEYVKLSDRIEKLFNKKKISIQTFSDILRFNLLYTYGGIWCDATLLFFDRLPLFENISKYGFWSLNIDCEEKKRLWGEVYPVTYTTFFLCCHKKNNIMKSCVELYNSYYEKYCYCIDYFMNDYFLILCMKYGLDRNSLQNIPKSNSNPFVLINTINQNKKINFDEIKIVPQKMNWRQNITSYKEYILDKERNI